MATRKYHLFLAQFSTSLSLFINMIPLLGAGRHQQLCVKASLAMWLES